ncbi:hypothetical protein [Bradyrhizobium sp. CSA207]|uniref:hypothetical protein n=1 Tax=Bradyrhizobium sp. CSA207 TaxID=2698826 RepID=UPI0023AF23F9|nr:hypothetical protein [Bradyrhizobium sp. CSA207]
MSHIAFRLRFCALIQNVALKPVNNSRAALTQIKFFDASSLNQFRCESFRIVYSLSRRGAHDLETSAVLENGASVQIGGGVHVGGA